MLYLYVKYRHIMSKAIRLNESDLRHMVRKVVNEVMTYEGDGPMAPAHDKYYFKNGWQNRSDNRFKCEGAVGENFEGFIADIKKYVERTLEEFEQKKGSSQRAMDSWLATAKERHGRYTKPTQKKHELQVRGVNKFRGTNYPEYLKPGGSDYYLYDRYMKDIEGETEFNKRWLDRQLRLSVDMPTEDHNSSWGSPGWKRYAQMAAKSKTFQIDPANIEGSAKEAWDLFNEYASQTPEVIGWFLWSWSAFEPTLMPILNSEVGQEISDEDERISKFYDSLGYKGD
jgi:hypothetical protein